MLICWTELIAILRFYWLSMYRPKWFHPLKSTFLCISLTSATHCKLSKLAFKLMLPSIGSLIIDKSIVLPCTFSEFSHLRMKDLVAVGSLLKLLASYLNQRDMYMSFGVTPPSVLPIGESKFMLCCDSNRSAHTKFERPWNPSYSVLVPLGHCYYCCAKLSENSQANNRIWMSPIFFFL